MKTWKFITCVGCITECCFCDICSCSSLHQTLPFLVRLLRLLLILHFLIFSQHHLAFYFFSIFMSLFSFTHTFNNNNNNSNKTAFFSFFLPLSHTLFFYRVETSEQCKEALPRDVFFLYIAYMCSRYIWYLYTDVKL